MRPVPQAADKVRGAGGSSPCRGLGQSPKALCRSIFRERCERPKDARNAALSKTMGFSTVWGTGHAAGPFMVYFTSSHVMMWGT